MTPSETERQILLMHIGTVNSPDDNEELMDLRDIVARLQRSFDEGQAFRLFPRKGTVREGDDAMDEHDARREQDADDDEARNIIFISDMQVTEGHATILLSYGDADGAPPAFLNVRTRHSRTVMPGEEETNGYSAHMIIDLNEQRQRGFLGLHRCTLERMPHLGKTIVIDLLNRLLRLDRKEHNDLFFRDPETGRQRVFYPKLTATMQMSQTLLEDLQHGTLSHIDLTTRQHLDQVDEDIAVQVQRRTLRIKPTFVTENPENIRQRLNRLARWAGDNQYEEMQVHVKGSPHRPGVSPRFATTLDDAAEALYSRIEVLDGYEGLFQCYEAIHEPLMGDLVNLLGNEQLWRRD